MTATQKLLGLDYIGWAKDAARQAVAWLEGNGGKTTDRDREAFGEGYRQGYLKAVADLQMRGFLPKK